MIRCYEGGYLELPEGRYQLKVEDCQETLFKDKNYFLFKFLVTDGEYAGGRFQNRFPLWKVNAMAKKIGGFEREMDERTKQYFYDVHPMDLAGRTFLVTVKPNEWQGKVYNNCEDDWEEVQVDPGGGEAPF